MGGPYFATTLTTTAKRQFSMQCDDLTTQFAKQKDIRWVGILVSSKFTPYNLLDRIAEELGKRLQGPVSL